MCPGEGRRVGEDSGELGHRAVGAEHLSDRDEPLLGHGGVDDRSGHGRLVDRGLERCRGRPSQGEDGVERLGEAEPTERPVGAQGGESRPVGAARLEGRRREARGKSGHRGLPFGGGDGVHGGLELLRDDRVGLDE